MLKDIEIASQCNMKPINQIADKLNIPQNYIENYGKYKAKISLDVMNENKPNGKLVLVTSINPTPAGEGKTTVTVGLGQGLNKIGKNAIIALREPSLGPVFGIKGGATGGGYSQVVPMEDINLHFTGDIHAITCANNLICAIIDNHLQQGNVLNIDNRRILFKRCLDMNDRALRNINIGLGGKINGVPREDNFVITVASEIMAILCLAKDLQDLKQRIGNILIGFSYDDMPVYVKDLGVAGAVAVLLKDAIKPNLVQTLENTPVLIHGGPFANIAHGCNSLTATKLGLKLADYCITEAGFGSDLGAEKFLDIKCRYGELTPNAVVIVATIKALKYNGGVNKQELADENVNALSLGLKNLEKHIANIKKYDLPTIVAINKFNSDTENEIKVLSDFCNQNNVEFSLCEGFAKGGEGVVDLANKVVACCEKTNNFKPLYDINLSIEQKIETIAKEIYGAYGVDYSAVSKKSIATINKLGKSDLPVCIAKTQYSFSDNPNLLGCPTGFKISVKDVKLCSGAGFIVVYTGDVMVMPGLPKKPAAYEIDIDENGNTVGLF